MRRRASAGSTAPASRRAPARLVRDASTLVAGWSRVASLWTVSSRRASPPKKATPARAPSGWWRRASRTQSTAATCPPAPRESEASTRNITATRRDVRGMARPARAATRRATMPARRMTAARHCRRLTPRRRRLRTSSTASVASRAMTNHRSHGRSPVACRSPGRAARSGTGRPAAGARFDSAGSALTANVMSGRPSWRTVQNPVASAMGAAPPAARVSCTPPGASTVAAPARLTGRGWPTRRSAGGRAAPASSVRRRSPRRGKATCSGRLLWARAKVR